MPTHHEVKQLQEYAAGRVGSPCQIDTLGTTKDNISQVHRASSLGADCLISTSLRLL